MLVSISVWRDLTDGHLYHEGDKFPFDGREISETRINELASGLNLAGKVLIRRVADPVEEIPTEEVKQPEEAVEAKETDIKEERAKRRGRARKG